MRQITGCPLSINTSSVLYSKFIRYVTVLNVCTVLDFPSVLWCCWFGDRKGIWPVKNWVVRCWHGYFSGARCRLAYGPVDANATHWLLLQQNQDWFYLPFWYHFIRVVPGKGPLNGCVCMCYCTKGLIFKYVIPQSVSQFSSSFDVLIVVWRVVICKNYHKKP